jgi:hypothetical protein
MGRLEFIVSAGLVLVSLAALSGCGSSTPATPGFGVPAVIKLAPTPAVSIDLGSTVLFSASALNGNRSPLTTTFGYRSSNPRVVSIAENGLACAGTWDNVTNPVVCTPGGVGSAQITASSSGVVSSPTTVYVHQHIAQIKIVELAQGSGVPPLGPGNCYTAASGSLITAHDQSYEASAFADDATGQPTLDISSSVGPFSWASSQPQVATLTPLSTLGVANGQVTVTAHTPGMTQVSAGIANTISGPISFTTCPVQSIALAVRATGGTTITAPKGTSSSITPTVVDVAGNPIAPTLTWSSSNTAVASVSSTGGVSSPGAGGATITASCVAPTCNINLSPPQSIYPVTPVSATYTGTAATPFSILVASSNATCAANAHCQAFLLPIGGTPPVAANPVLLTNVPGQVPNSIQFLPGGATAYIGSQKGLLAAAGAASSPTITTNARVTGRVLAVSPDGKKVIVSDTASPVNQVFIIDTASNASSNLLLAGATAAAFSPDSLKAFIVAGSTLYVYSTQSAFQTAALPAAGTDVAFLANGMFGYIAEGGSGFSYLATCDDPGSPISSQVQSQAGAVSFLRPLPDGSGFVGLAPPDVVLIHATVSGLPLPVGVAGCPAPFPSGQLTVSNSVTSIPLGAGAFTPVAFLLSSDGQKVYTVVQNSGTILVYGLISGVSSSISLSGNPNPLSAALAPDGQTLYVGASDGKVHVVNTVSGGDVAQVDVPSSTLCTITTGGTQPNCLPDLLAVKP